MRVPASGNLVRRPEVHLQSKTESNLLSYAAAAGAAGVSLLALAQPSEAKVVYTPTHQIIGYPGTLYLDVNNDGITDFTMSNYRFISSNLNASYDFLAVTTRVQGNKMVGNQMFASALTAGFQIGPDGPFAVPIPSHGVVMDHCNRSTGGGVTDSGNWANATNKYLGLRFFVGGQVHFGWARFSLKRTQCETTILLSGYAYETAANKPIAAGKTRGPLEASEPFAPASRNTSPSLGMLAQGAPSLEIWYKEDERKKN